MVAVMPIGLPGDTLPCRVARPSLRAPVAPVRVVLGPELAHEKLPVSHTGRPSGTSHAVLSPGGDTVALMTLGADGIPRLSIQELRTGRELAAIDSIWSSAGAAGLAYSRDGQWIASAQPGGTVRIVSVPRGRVQVELPHHRYMPANLPPLHGAPPETWHRELTSVAISADGRHAVSAGADGHVILWDVRRGRALWIHDLRGGAGGYPYPRTQAAFLADGRLLVMSPRDVEVWSAERGTLVGVLRTPVGAVPAMRDSVPVMRYSSVVDVAVSGNGRLVAVHGRSSEWEGSRRSDPLGDWIETWWWGECPEPGRPIRIPDSTGKITISPDARWIAAISNSAVYVWDAFTGLERFRIPQSYIRTLTGDIARAAAFAPDGTVLYSIHSDPRPVIAWTLDDPGTGRPPQRR